MQRVCPSPPPPRENERSLGGSERAEIAKQEERAETESLNKQSEVPDCEVDEKLYLKRNRFSIVPQKTGSTTHGMEG